MMHLKISSFLETFARKRFALELLVRVGGDRSAANVFNCPRNYCAFCLKKESIKEKEKRKNVSVGVGGSVPTFLPVTLYGTCALPR